MTVSPLEAFLILTTIASLVFNIIQWREGRAAREPLCNALVGTFNEVKSRANYISFAYNALFHENNPHADVATLRWEHGHFLQSEWSALLGVQEQLVSVLVSLRPDDKDGRMVFRASDYGLTEQDKEIRAMNYENYKASLGSPLRDAPLEAGSADVAPESRASEAADDSVAPSR